MINDVIEALSAHAELMSECNTNDDPRIQLYNELVEDIARPQKIFIIPSADAVQAISPDRMVEFILGK